MNDVVALIAYVVDDEIEEVLHTFEDITQAREYFDQNITSPKDFYDAGDVDKKQSMMLFVLDKKATLEWSLNQEITIQTSRVTET